MNLYLPLMDRKADDEPSSPSPAPEGVVDIWPRVLVVDDNPDQLDLVQSNLTIYHYTALRARTGREAVELFKQASDEGNESPADMVLLDMVMEEDFDGLDTLKAIRELYPSQKIIIVSAHDRGDRGQKACDLGAGWVTKPYTFGNLDTMIREHLAKG